MRARMVMVMVAGCSGSPKQNVVPATPVKIAPPARVFDATPDKASGDAREAELAKIAAGYVDAFINADAELTPDGKHVVIQSNRDGIQQLYLGDVDKPADKPLRLVSSNQRTLLQRVTPDGRAVLFRQDTNADENWSIYRVDLDGKNLVELTPGEKLNRVNPIIVPGKPDTMFFSARKINEARSTLYSASATKPDTAKPIYSDELPGFLVDVDPQAKTAIFVRIASHADHTLLRVDLATGKATKLWPTDTKVTTFAGRLSVDGKQLYVATDGGGEDNMLVALDPHTGKELARWPTTPKTAQIAGLQLAKTGGLLAVSLTVGEHSELVFLDSKLKQTATTVKMPFGQGTFGKFSSDGKRILALWSTTAAPTDIYSIDPAKGTAELLRTEQRAAVAGMPKVKTSIVEIPAFDGGKIPMLVHVREGEEGTPHPTIVTYHGGPAAVSMARWSAMWAFWLSLGYAIVEPNVRGSTGYGRAYESADDGKRRIDAFRDIETSSRWVSHQPWADKDRLVVYGGSYGGYTTLIALSRWPDLWRAGVNLVGIVNFKTFITTTSGVNRTLSVTEFGDPDKDAEFLAQISPLTDVGKIVDPTFVYAGANDPRVPRSESDQIVKALREHGVATEYMVADNEGHSFAHRETQIELLARCARFLETHMK